MSVYMFVFMYTCTSTYKLIVNVEHVSFCLCFGYRPLSIVIFALWSVLLTKSCTCKFSCLSVCDGASFDIWTK